MKIKDEYYLDEENRYVIEDYNNKKSFSSFLPGIAGLKGNPLWVFYVNRAQGISSFGVRDKDKAIMEFNPAFRSYQKVNYSGFRTFIKINEDIYEPFSDMFPNKSCKNKMIIGANDLEIEEVNKGKGLKTNVLYYNLPEENISVLVRKLTIENTDKKDKKIEFLDGMPELIPYGIDNTGFKEIGQTLKAWMSVCNVENKIPFYKLRASAADTEDIEGINGGNFYLSFLESDEKNLLKPIVDPDIIFGNNLSLSFPNNFADNNIEDLFKIKQITSNKLPSAFFGKECMLKSGEHITLYSLIGYSESLDKINNVKDKICNTDFIESKHIEAKNIVRDLTEDIKTKTSSTLFDEYSRQTYLDNILRGGYPIKIQSEDNNLIYHVYSRKHGDLERDYNYFVTESEFYSSGNGNFRDVNQNRRNDVSFNPYVEDFNIKTFMNLIQTDGYNPLVINGLRFHLKDKNSYNFISDINEMDGEKLIKYLKKPFTLGKLYSFILDNNFKVKIDIDELVKKVLDNCETYIDAVHGEGFWTDHFTYNLDLVEDYLRIFPDKEKQVLFDDRDYTYYDSSYKVLKRQNKYKLKGDVISQINSVVKDEEKEIMIQNRLNNKNLVRDKKGYGEIYKCNLIEKLISLAINKYSVLDPYGMGIEMEAGKPGWDDALNGLPGIIGSCVADSLELLRILNYINTVMLKYSNQEIKLPKEVFDLMMNIKKDIDMYKLSNNSNKDFEYWDKVSNHRENHRENVFYGFSGEEVKISLEKTSEIFDEYRTKLYNKIQLAYKENDDMYPTYFYYEVESFEIVEDKYVKVNSFKQKSLPLFLEGFVKAIKVQENSESIRDIYKKVKLSNLYDNKLKMYKVNESLEKQDMKIGRIRAFTSGWLENETIWLHMEYKYMLGLLEGGLYDEFFQDFKNVFVPFLSSNTYGRSILENSSFIGSSANSDPDTNGRGFIARLSGAAAEFLSIWNILMCGKTPFKYVDNELILQFKPVLPDWLFDEKNEVSFKFLGQTEVTYSLNKKINTYEEFNIINIELNYKDGTIFKLNKNLINEPYSKDIRQGKVSKIIVKINN
ncbi:MAG: cellobiose phosphorylase [Clostridiaceae bacterium]